MNQEPHRHHFTSMPLAQQIEAIQRLAAAGTTDYGIAHATGLAVEQIRRLLDPTHEGVGAQRASEQRPW